MTAPAHQFRVTKYDPARRDHKGVFHGGEWTSISNVGDQFEGVTLSMAEYGRVEDAYVEAAQRFMMETGVAALTVRDLDNPSEAEARRFPPEGTTLDMKAFGRALRSVLREDSWCRFESPDGFVHVGYDYYMYVGTTPGPAHQFLLKFAELWATGGHGNSSALAAQELVRRTLLDGSRPAKGRDV